MERISADKREVSLSLLWSACVAFILIITICLATVYIFQVESLSRKYEEKYKQGGDVASKLTIEEATFRDIQVSITVLFEFMTKVVSSFLFYNI